ncbi:MAG: RNA polymerase sigma factor [Ekhidna sp.]
MKTTEPDFLKKIEAHKGIIHKVSRTYFEDADDREDLSQEIILQLWKSYSSFQGKSQFSSWMYRVALNTAILYFKKEKKKVIGSDITGLEEKIANSESDGKENQLAHFYRAVHQLNKIEKALILQFIEGFSGDEIASNLGMTAGNVRVKLNRTKKKLEKIIKDQGYEF